LRKFRLAIIAISCWMVVSCSGLLTRVHITGIDISPRTLPPEGGKVKIVVKTYNAGDVRVYFKRANDGKTFSLSLGTEFWLGMMLGEQKWDGEITLPPNNDPEGKDQVYKVTVVAYESEFWSSHERDAGKVVVKGKLEGTSSEVPNNETTSSVSGEGEGQ
jgi:hypothetical protein